MRLSRSTRPIWIAGLAAAALAIGTATAPAKKIDYKLNDLPCCGYEHISPIVWSGRDPRMALERLAAYCGPILWFSPDEPLLQGAEDTGILIPAAFPFEAKPDTPVVYYRLRNIVRTSDAKKLPYSTALNRGESRLDLANISTIQLDYFFYYPSEEGFGGHAHDVEALELTILVWHRPQCTECPYSLVVLKAVAKAHGVLWYDNTLMMDPDTRFPLTILVEEGKHASCTDKNGDGYYTPGYDVNQRVNDAWGVRDIIRGGGLFSGGFESWFAKVREPKDRVIPPLPADSPNRTWLAREARQAGGLAVYELRPFPRPELAASDPHLVPFIADKGSPDWPTIETPPAHHRHAPDALRRFVRQIPVPLRANGRGFGSLVDLPAVHRQELQRASRGRLAGESSLCEGPSSARPRLQHPLHALGVALDRRLFLAGGRAGRGG